MKKKTLSIVDEYLNIRDVKVGETGSMMFFLFLFLSFLYLCWEAMLNLLNLFLD